MIGLDDEHVERAGAVDALDADELDVNRGRRARDESNRPALGGDLRQRGHAVGHGRNDVSGSDDAQVVVGHQRERAAPGGAHAVEHDRSRFGDRERAARQHAVQLVELAGRERGLVPYQLDAIDLPRRGLRRHRDAARLALLARGHQRARQLLVAHSSHGRPIVSDAPAKQVHGDRVAAGPKRARLGVGTRNLRDLGHWAESGAHARQHGFAVAAHGAGRRRRRAVTGASATTRGRSARAPPEGRASPTSREAQPSRSARGPTAQVSAPARSSSGSRTRARQPPSPAPRASAGSCTRARPARGGEGARTGCRS